MPPSNPNCSGPINVFVSACVVFLLRLVSFFWVVASVAAAAGDPTAAQLAREAKKAQESGQIVHAYLLYAQAAARDPETPSYRLNREALAPLARLLTQSGVQSATRSLAELERAAAAEPLEPPPPAETRLIEQLRPLPELQAAAGTHDFTIRADEKEAFNLVAAAYRIKVLFDAQFVSQPNVRLRLEGADFRTAMEQLTAATGTFLFPISTKAVFVARDTQQKRAEYEPNEAVAVPLPDASDPKEIVDAVTAVRGALQLQHMFLDGAARTVLIRDRASKVRIARSLLESLILPRAQVSIDVQLIALDESKTIEYGLSLPTSYPIVDFGHLGAFRTILSNLPQGVMNFVKIGGGATFFGLGITNSTVFATYSRTYGQVIFDATVNVDSGQTAQLHVGDKFPIAQALYSGPPQSGGSLYNPIGQVSLEDLGLILKLTPRVVGEGDIALELDAQYRALAGISINTVPEISQRTFQGSVRLRADDWALLAGLTNDSRTVARTGLLGLGQIPWLNQLVTDNTRRSQSSETLILLKPTVTRLPVAATISPQFFAGAREGPKVLL